MNIGRICCCCISRAILLTYACLFFSSSILALSCFLIASVYCLRHSFVSFITLFIFSISVVFLRSIANAKFIPTDIASAAIVAVTRSGNIGCVVYCGLKSWLTRLPKLKKRSIVIAFHFPIISLLYLLPLHLFCHHYS